MHRRTLLWFFAIALLPGLRAAEDPHLEKLLRTYIAPCCWRENLLHHQSPQAETLRREIRSAVAAGRTDEEIRRGLLAQYSQRILAIPEGASGQWLTWTPIAVLAAGAASIARFLRRSLRTPKEV